VCWKWSPADSLFELARCWPQGLYTTMFLCVRQDAMIDILRTRSRALVLFCCIKQLNPELTLTLPQPECTRQDENAKLEGREEYMACCATPLHLHVLQMSSVCSHGLRW
jgi:hypothetical protein